VAGLTSAPGPCTGEGGGTGGADVLLAPQNAETSRTTAMAIKATSTTVKERRCVFSIA
jgi:hypothetical protein